MGKGRFFGTTSDCSARLSESSDREAEPIEFSGPIAFSGPILSADELFCDGRIRPIKPSGTFPQKTPLLDFEHRSKEQSFVTSKEDNDTEEKQRGRRGYLWRNKKESRNRWQARSLSPRRNSFSHWGRKSNGNGQRNDDVIDNSAEEEGLQGIKIGDPASSSTFLKPRGSRRKWSLTDIFFRRCKSDGGKVERDEMELSFSSYAKLSISSEKDEHRVSGHSNKMANTTTNRSASILTPNRMGVSASAQELHRAPSPNRRVVPASAQELHRAPSPNRRGVPASAHELHRAPSPNRRGVQASAQELYRAPSPNRRGVPVSAHELHYTENRALSQELRRKTFLPYRHGVLGCLRFPSPTECPQGHVLQSPH